MGRAKIIDRIRHILSKKRKARAKRSAKLAELLERLERKLAKLEAKLADAPTKAQRHKLGARVQVTKAHLAKGREALAHLAEG